MSFFVRHPTPSELYTLSLHDALPISPARRRAAGPLPLQRDDRVEHPLRETDRKSTRLNSSHQIISYAVFCLKKKILPMSSPVTLTSRSGRPRLLPPPPALPSRLLAPS